MAISTVGTRGGYGTRMLGRPPAAPSARTPLSLAEGAILVATPDLVNNSEAILQKFIVQ
jgi:hypothetical protein